MVGVTKALALIDRHLRPSVPAFQKPLVF